MVAEPHIAIKPRFTRNQRLGRLNKVRRNRKKRLKSTLSKPISNTHPPKKALPTVTVDYSVQTVNSAGEETTKKKKKNMSILKTAVAPVSKSKSSPITNANILFDEGANETYITTQLSKKLGLKPLTIEERRNCLFGAIQKNEEVPVVKLKIHLPDKKKTMTLEALVKEELVSPIPLKEHNLASQLPEFQTIGLANAHTGSKRFKVDMVLSSDYTCDLLHTKFIEGQSGVRAQSTPWGYVFTGRRKIKKERKEEKPVQATSCC